jgi:glycosidase
MMKMKSKILIGIAVLIFAFSLISYQYFPDKEKPEKQLEKAHKEFLELYRKAIKYGGDLETLKQYVPLLITPGPVELYREAINELKEMELGREWAVLTSNKTPSNNLYPGWWLEGPIYEIDVELYPNHKFTDVTKDIPRLKKLGIKTIYLMPIWYGIGYGIWDYFRINPRYGSPADLKELVNTAHKHEIKVIFDLVISQTPFFSYIYEEKPDWLIHTYNTSFLKHQEIEITDYYLYRGKKTIYPGKFILHEGKTIGQIMHDGKIVFRHYPHFYWGWAINMTNEEVIDYFVAVATYYIKEYDIDGWRVDAPQNNIHPLIEGNYSSLPLLREIKEEITKIKAHSILITEWDGPLSEKAHFAGERAKPLFDEIAELSYDWPFSGWLRTTGFHQGFLAKVITNQISSAEFVNYFTSQKILYNRTRLRFFNNHDTERVEKIYPQHHKNLLVLISTVPGVPMIYMTDELGAKQAKHKIYAWKNPDPELERFYQKIFEIREKNDALKFGTIHNVWAGGDKAYAYLRSYNGNHLVIILNFQSKPMNVVLSLSYAIKINETSEYEVINLITNEAKIYKGSDLKSFQIKVGENEATIFIIKERAVKNRRVRA